MFETQYTYFYLSTFSLKPKPSSKESVEIDGKKRARKSKAGRKTMMTTTNRKASTVRFFFLISSLELGKSDEAGNVQGTERKKKSIMKRLKSTQ